MARAAATRRQCRAQRPAASHRRAAACPSLEAAVDIRLEARESAVAAHLPRGGGGCCRFYECCCLFWLLFLLLMLWQQVSER